MSESTFDVALERQQRYAFDIDFGVPGAAPFVMDEPSPLGDDSGPNAARVLAAAVAHCLSASALFCFEKSRVPVTGFRARVHGTLVRDERRRLRIGSLDVQLHPQVAAADAERLTRCLELFEDFCIVTQSVRRGLEVAVTVEPDVTAVDPA